MDQKQILVVEDNKLERDMLREILKDKYEILEAENGEEGLAILQKNRETVNLILLDIIMPVMDGYTFLDKMKADSVLGLIPVIVMTQNDSEADEIDALKHGATDYVPKPYHPEVIRHRIANLLRLRETSAMVNQFVYDRLTGTYTKEYFYRKVREILDQNPDTEYNLLCCNLENFKIYNDTFGREAGDRLLIEEARILRNRVAPEAICCRYTADRFLCLTDRESERKGRECFRQAREYTRSELSENISVKLGVYEIFDRQAPVEQMCDRALWVVDTIKGIYDRHVAVYTDDLRKQLVREQMITDAMETALFEKQFVVYFQPKYNLHDGRLMGAEALVRWIHPEWGYMSPGEFIPLFEKNGFISKLDVYVWEKTCEKLREWMDKGYQVVPVSVNVSREDVYHAYLVEHFCSLLAQYHIDPSYLHLEITESAYTKHPEQIIRIVEDLRRRGFVIEMDDFGSGYSSLNMLGQMAIDVIKLDMGFIRSELKKPVEQSILNDVVNMAHRLHLNVVAEGVETAEQKTRLRELGCDCAQGYYYAKPLPEAQFEDLLKKSQSDQENTGQSAPEFQPAGAKKTALVIEDNQINRDILGEILAEDYFVLTAKDGQEGIEILKQQNYAISVILLDIQMPVMDGYEFLEKLQANPYFNHIPVVVTTVLSSFEEEEKCLKLGASDFIEKPYNARRILMRINNLVHLKEYGSILSGMEIDSLTGFKNRKAYFEDISAIEHDPKRNQKPVGIVFADINGLKTINDSEGHEAGDHLIAEVSGKIRDAFGDSEIYRLGGDEFVIFCFADTKERFEEKLAVLEKSWNRDRSAALGSVWLEQAVHLEESVTLADQNMYRNKSKAYQKKHPLYRQSKDKVSDEMLWKLEEVSELLPGGFLCFEAGADGQILFCNTGLAGLYGCESREEFLALTGSSFHKAVHPDDLARTQSLINARNEKESETLSVTCRIVRKDGEVRTVRGFGRFVHTSTRGDVFYVFLNEVSEGKESGRNKEIP